MPDQGDGRAGVLEITCPDAVILAPLDSCSARGMTSFNRFAGNDAASACDPCGAGADYIVQPVMSCDVAMRQSWRDGQGPGGYLRNGRTRVRELSRPVQAYAGCW